MLFVVKNRIKKLFLSLEKELFDGNNQLFLREIKTAQKYGEWGTGLSTIFAVNIAKKDTITIDTSREWLIYVQGKIDKNNLELWHEKFVDLGKVEDWGYPTNYEQREKFINYAKKMFEDEMYPDLLLVDGRFRVLCFLYTFMVTKPGTKIIFDDFYTSERYRSVETVALPIERYGRQALFIVPQNIDKKKITELMNDFKFIMD